MPIFESWLDRAGPADGQKLTDREAYSASPSHERFLPKLATVFAEGYGGKRLRADVLAGLTVAVVSIVLKPAHHFLITLAWAQRPGSRKRAEVNLYHGHLDCTAWLDALP